MIKVKTYIQHSHNIPFTCEQNSGEYMLSPNLSLTLDEIISKYVQGLPIPSSILHDDAVYGVQRKNMELADASEVLAESQSKVKNILKAQDEANARSKEAKDKAKKEADAKAKAEFDSAVNNAVQQALGSAVAR